MMNYNLREVHLNRCIQLREQREELLEKYDEIRESYADLTGKIREISDEITRTNEPEDLVKSLSQMVIVHESCDILKKKIDECRAGYLKNEFDYYHRSVPHRVFSWKTKYILHFDPGNRERFIRIRRGKKIICEVCAADKIEIIADNVFMCKECYHAMELKYNQVTHIKDAQDYLSGYQRSDYYMDYIERFLCRKIPQLTTQFFEELKAKIIKDGIHNMKKLSPDMLDLYLKKAGRIDLAHDKIYIFGKLSGLPPPQITSDDLELMKLMFREVISIWDSVKLPGQHSFISYPYVFRKILELLENYDEYLKYIRITSSPRSIKKLDTIWMVICKKLNYQFIPTMM